MNIIFRLLVLRESLFVLNYCVIFVSLLTSSMSVVKCWCEWYVLVSSAKRVTFIVVDVLQRSLI